MHKCQQTFSSLENGDPEVQTEELNGTEVNISVRIVRNCCDCGTEVKEYTFEMDEDFSSELEDHTQQHTDKEEAAPEYFLGVVLAEMTERTQTKDRHGKPIKNYRYMKHFYGVEAAFTITCEACGEVVVDSSLTDDVQASGMDDLE